MEHLSFLSTCESTRGMLGSGAAGWIRRAAVHRAQNRTMGGTDESPGDVPQPYRPPHQRPRAPAHRCGDRRARNVEYHARRERLSGEVDQADRRVRAGRPHRYSCTRDRQGHGRYSRRADDRGESCRGRGNIATEAAARAAPDGYTLQLTLLTSAVNESLYKNWKIRFVEHLEAIGGI